MKALNSLFLLLFLNVESESSPCWDLQTSGYSNSPKLQCCVKVCKDNWDDDPGAGWHYLYFSCVDGCLRTKAGRTISQCESDCNPNPNIRSETGGQCTYDSSKFNTAKCKLGCSYTDASCSPFSYEGCPVGTWNSLGSSCKNCSAATGFYCPANISYDEKGANCPDGYSCPGGTMDKILAPPSLSPTSLSLSPDSSETLIAE